MVVVVWVIAGHLADEVFVGAVFDFTVGEEFADCGRNACGRSWGALVFADDDSFPFVEQRVGPDHGVDAVLAQGEEEIHDREWEQDVGVNEDASHRDGSSVGESCGVDDLADALATPAPQISAGLESDDIGQRYSAVAAVGQVT
jgi:hypothetical protein